MNVAYPIQFDARGRTAAPSDADRHIRDMIELILFTSPGERVNRPDFGTGLLQMVFQPNSTEVAAALQVTAQASLQRWMGTLIDVTSLEVQAVEATLNVTVQYIVQGTKAQQVARFSRGIVP